MATPSLSFTLNDNLVMVVEATTLPMQIIGKGALGIIYQIASGVDSWANSDTIGYNNENSVQLILDNIRYTVINQSDIYFKYTTEALP